MTSLVCPASDVLKLLARGQLSPSDAEQLGPHVQQCSTCSAFLRSLQTVGEVATPASTLTDAPHPVAGSEPLHQIGRYQVVGQLGAGGMGVVYRAHDPQLGRDVAIKMPRFQGADESCKLARQRFLREARAAALRHAHVCPIYDVGEAQGRPYVVMALVEGETLSDRLRRQGRFAESTEAVALILRVADALAAVHAAHIIHRDLKPGNILLDRSGQPYLTDFGLARAADSEELTAVGQLVGTPAYMAPEQVSPEFGPVGGAADQYSLAVVLYQMLTGRLPFEGTAAALIFQIATRPVSPPSQYCPDIDPRIESVCMKALAKEPTARFGSVQEFATALALTLQPSVEPLAALSQPPKRERTPAAPNSALAHQALAARYYLEKRTEAGLRKSIETYYRILDLEPTYAPAWAGLAVAYHFLSVWGHVSPTSACPRAKSAALRALELDRSLGEAHATLGAILMEYDWDLVQAEQFFRQALQTNPDDALLHRVYGKCLVCQGRPDEAIAELRRAEELEPLSLTHSVALGRHGFLLARRYDEAVHQFRRVLQTDPDFWLAHRFLGWAHLLQGDPTAALPAFEAARRLNDNPTTQVDQAFALATVGQPARARETLDTLKELAKHRFTSPDHHALLFLSLGDKEQAFVWLEKAVTERSEWLSKFAVDPVLDRLRSDPRFPQLLQHVKGAGAIPNTHGTAQPDQSHG